MNLLHRIAAARATARRESIIHDGLARLDARALGDLGIERADIRAVAHFGARVGPEGTQLRDALAHVRRAKAAQGDGAPLTGLAALVAQLWQAAAESDLGRGVHLRRFWRRAFRQVRAELRSYSPRELMADLRLSPAEIDDIAAEGADQRVAAFVAANPAFRRAALGRRTAAA
ncbi:MAG: hypothetical protein ACJ8H8_20645 [Geminicoccaceae bacterium]